MKELITYCIKASLKDITTLINNYTDSNSNDNNPETTLIQYIINNSQYFEVTYIISYLVIISYTIDNYLLYYPLSLNNPSILLLKEFIYNILEISKDDKDVSIIIILLYKYIIPYYKPPLYEMLTPIISEIFTVLSNILEDDLNEYINEDDQRLYLLLYNSQNVIEQDRNHLKSIYLQSLFNICTILNKTNMIEKSPCLDNQKIIYFNKSNSYIKLNAGEISPPYTIDFDIFIKPLKENSFYSLFTSKSSQIMLEYKNEESCELVFTFQLKPIRFVTNIFYNEWIHLTITSTSHIIALYYNYIISESHTLNKEIYFPLQYIGNYSDNSFIGSIQDFSVWNLSRTSEEIINTKNIPYDYTIVPSSLIIHFLFNENVGNIIIDRRWGLEPANCYNIEWIKPEEENIPFHMRKKVFIYLYIYFIA